MGVVLIAFERESEQSALEQLLASRGHRVMRSSNGLAALDAARREPPHAIVSDIVLPRMDGFALCRKWKQDERLQSIPFIFYTRRHDDPKYERFALELGAERFLARSVAPEALLEALDELLPNVPKSDGKTAPAPDEPSSQRSAALERAQQQARAQLEKAQQAQAALRAQIEQLEATNERLAASEARFRRVFESNPLPMWITDRATGGFIAVNDAALALFGYSRAEFLALKASALQAPGPGEPDLDLRPHLRQDGSTRLLAVSTMQIEFDGRSAELVCAHDSSEYAELERKRRTEAVTPQAVLESLADGCWILDADGRIKAVNAAYLRMSGYSREALLAMNASQIEDSSSGETTMRLALGRVRGGGQYESKHRRADGTFIEVEVSVGLLEGGQGESVLLIRDVSRRRQAAIAQRTLQRQLEFLVELFKHSDSLDEPSILRRIVDHAVEATGSPLACLYFVQPAARTMSLAAWRGRSQSQAMIVEAEPHLISSGGPFVECVRARRATVSNDVTPKPQRDGLPEIQRYLAVPMLAGEEVVAVLAVANRESSYGEEDSQALETLADGAWRAIDAKRTRVHTLSALQRTDVALHALIDSMVRMVERHDPYTAGSSRRLAALAVAIGREAGLDGERQHALRIAALLHDVGNLVVPASILSKPAPLTEAEQAVMRTHVEEGCQLLADIDFGAPVADIVYQSHERYNGSGYPRGLKGEEILLEARILGIADTIEAMCSPRPYRPAVGMDAALDEINRASGRLYDPALVNACTRLIRERGFQLPE
jgi:PAS domain S-box-containing protein